MGKKTFWRGVEGVEFLWHGEWLSPEVRYGKMVAYSEDVECSLAHSFEDFAEIEDTWGGNHEEEFSQYCRENRSEVVETIAQYQTIDSKYDATHCLWDEILESITKDEYEYVWATLRYKKCKLKDIEDFEQRIEKTIEDFTRREEMQFDWWKVDYSEHRTSGRQYFGGAKIDSIEDLFFAMEDGF